MLRAYLAIPAKFGVAEGKLKMPVWAIACVPADTKRKLKEMETAYLEQLETEAAGTVSPEKAVRQVFRQYNGHLRNADFSGLTVTGHAG